MSALALAAALASLNGAWSVDLRTAPSAPAYSQPMELTVAPDGSVSGRFYGAPIDAGRAADNNGRTCFAFNTSDQSGPYHHAGCLKGQVIEGQSWSTGRNFLLNWRAERTPTR